MDDRTLRALERTLVASPDDEQAARAYLRALARDGLGEPWAPAGVPSLPLPQNRRAFAKARGDPEPPPVDESRFDGGRFLGPLLADEAVRLREIDAEALDTDAVGLVWLRAQEERGKLLFAATLRVRLVALERVVRDAPDTFASWCALHAALDAGGEDALEVFVKLVGTGSGRVADRAARLLASRPEQRVGRRISRLLTEVPSEARPRIHAAIENGSVPLDREAKRDLRVAITRELPGPQRGRAYRTLLRVATREDLEHDFEHAPAPEVRAAALEALLERTGITDARDYLRRALADRDPEVRRAAIKALASARWLRDGRTIDWTLGRLLDPDRAVRHEAIRILRRVGVPPRQMERLKLIVTHAPPGVRPALLRLLELVSERTDRRSRSKEKDD